MSKIMQMFKEYYKIKWVIKMRLEYFINETIYISVQEGYKLYVYHYNSEKEYNKTVINGTKFHNVEQ